MDNSDKIYRLVFILIGILIFLLIVIGLISRIKRQKNEFGSKKKDVFYQPSISFNNRQSKNKTITPVVFQKISSSKRLISDFAGEDGFGEEDLSNLYQNELKKKLPLETDDFYAYYNQVRNKFIVVLKNNTEESKKRFFHWLEINGLKGQSEIFLFEEKFILPTVSENFSLASTSPIPTFSNNSFEILIDLLKIIFTNTTFNSDQLNSYSTPNSFLTPTSSTSNTEIDYSSPPLGYNPNAKGCYTPKRFIEVYADGLSPSGSPNCYQNVKERVESYLRTISFLGFNIRVHQKVVPYFQAVDQDLSSYKISGSTYHFSKGNYTFKNCGTYVFRCNVNASRCDRYDLCNSTCVLSPHSFGFAIDLNCDTNANRSSVYDIPPEAVAAFRRHGFRWGGEWNDAMHFEYLGELCSIN